MRSQVHRGEVSWSVYNRHGRMDFLEVIVLANSLVGCENLSVERDIWQAYSSSITSRVGSGSSSPKFIMFHSVPLHMLGLDRGTKASSDSDCATVSGKVGVVPSISLENVGISSMADDSPLDAGALKPSSCCCTDDA